MLHASAYMTVSLISQVLQFSGLRFGPSFSRSYSFRSLFFVVRHFQVLQVQRPRHIIVKTVGLVWTRYYGRASLVILCRRSWRRWKLVFINMLYACETWQAYLH